MWQLVNLAPLGVPAESRQMGWSHLRTRRRRRRRLMKIRVHSSDIIHTLGEQQADLPLQTDVPASCLEQKRVSKLRMNEGTFLSLTLTPNPDP